jgi:hypothetical protein
MPSLPTLTTPPLVTLACAVIACSSSPVPGGSADAAPARDGGAADCGVSECVRAVECVSACGGPVVQSGCCPCPTGTFDDLLCLGDAAAADGGGPADAPRGDAAPPDGAVDAAGADATAPPDAAGADATAPPDAAGADATAADGASDAAGAPPSDGSEVRRCGGIIWLACDPGETCDIRGCAPDMPGTCRPTPSECPLFFDPVCGCDGKGYDNDCERLRAGVRLDHDGPCVSDGAP